MLFCPFTNGGFAAEMSDAQSAVGCDLSDFRGSERVEEVCSDEARRRDKIRANSRSCFDEHGPSARGDRESTAAGYLGRSR